MLGLSAGPREVVEAQKTEAAFVLTPAEADACVELICPRGGNEGLEKFLERNQGRAGLHHIAFAVDDLRGALTELDQRGVPLIDKTPRPGARGHEVGFLHPKAAGGVLVELVSDHHKGHHR
jgi:methylmalonyl-CoA/ethylmalonyl-CoA epimerase